MTVHKQLIARVIAALLLIASVLTLGGCFLFNNPHAQFSFDPTHGYPPLTVHFDASASNSPNGAITDYAWDFDDGSIDTRESVDHTFYDKGTYSVTLTVTDSSGAVGAIMHSVEAMNRAPVAEFEYEVHRITMETEVWFDATDSYDPDGEIVGYSWDFGDNTIGGGDFIEHVYPRMEREYRVKLTVLDENGSKGIHVKYIHIGCCGSY